MNRLNKIWKDMLRRCEDPECDSYEWYGARGICVCPGWQRFGPFRDWALANGYQDDLTIDRIDNDGDYTPGNCRWATMKEQCNNRRDNLVITYERETKTLHQWAEHLEIPYHTLYSRLVIYGWPVESAFKAGVRKWVRRQ